MVFMREFEVGTFILKHFSTWVWNNLALQDIMLHIHHIYKEMCDIIFLQPEYATETRSKYVKVNRFKRKAWVLRSLRYAIQICHKVFRHNFLLIILLLLFKILIIAKVFDCEGLIHDASVCLQQNVNVSRRLDFFWKTLLWKVNVFVIVCNIENTFSCTLQRRWKRVKHIYCSDFFLNNALNSLGI